MQKTPTLVFIPGSWHKPVCYEKVIRTLRDVHDIKCVSISLPSTLDNPNATFKDDIDAARDAIVSETASGRDVVVVAHSYGGMVGNSAIKGLTRPKSLNSSHPHSSRGNQPDHASSTGVNNGTGHVVGLVLIASGFTITGLAFMDPLFGIPPPSWRADKETGYAVLVQNPREMFYHDLSDDEAEYWAGQLTTQSLKALFEGGEHAYAGWQDVPTWYVGTIEDKGLPVVLQRIQVGMARGQGGTVYHTELTSSHSPFLSMPDEVVAVLLDAVRTTSTDQEEVMQDGGRAIAGMRQNRYDITTVKLTSPLSWLKFGIPLLIGRLAGWGFVGFMALRRLWR